MSVISEQEIREKAYALGWDDLGFTEAKIPQEDIDAYLDWLRKKRHGKLAYMENQMRCDPTSLLPGAKHAIIFISYYKQEPKSFKKDAGLVASYARGRDYHNVHRKRLKKLVRWLEERSGKTGIAKGFSDSTPILEKALAVQAGLGWFGKNTLLIHRRYGTFTLLSGLLTTLDLEYEKSPDLRLPKCGVCTKCIDSCPTGAFIQPYELDATKCLSYHTIEMEGSLPDEIAKKNPGYVFGCDICQDVCPHNVRKPLSQTEDFSEEKGMGAYLTMEEIENLESESLYGTPLKRRGVGGLKLTLDQLG